MTVIAENDDLSAAAAAAAIADAAAPPAALAVWHVLLAQVHAHMRELAAHPARSVVLLPYAHLLPLAARLWAQQFPDGFAPRFETTHTWAARAGWFEPGASDLSFDHGRDLLTAASLLEGAGLGAQRALLAGPLVEQASQLGQLAASVPPAQRPAWAEQARAALPAASSDSPLALEAALGRIALAWAENSDYATDVLFAPRTAQTLDALIVVQGQQPDSLVAALAEHFFEQTVLLAWDLPAAAPGQVRTHACADAEDEAERAAACVLRHLAAGRAPVALVAGDRVLTRRISALLAAHGVPLHDETGWKLSTTHAAASLAAWLHACAPHASTDTVLDALKLSPACAPSAVRRLEQRLRRHAVRGWAQAAQLTQGQALTAQIETLRAPLAEPRRLCDWLAATRTLAEGAGLWPLLAADAAGQALIAALGLDEAALARWREWPAAQRRMRLGEYTRWFTDTLEAASFRPPHTPDAPVTILPLAQLLGRPFAALVLPGADEQRLPAAPEPAGPWTSRQRETLRLPSRDALRLGQWAAWRTALGVPHVDLLWRTSDDSGEPLLPSPLVQAMQLDGLGLTPGADPRPLRAVPAAPSARPAPVGQALPAQPLSASGYDMLRACPYRFFALRQLGLSADGELDVDIGKRDWGNWVHAVLHAFHTALQQHPGADRQALMHDAAEHATQALGLNAEPGEFMPFAVAWPALRDAYLKWLAEHEASGAVFESAEQRFDNEPRGLLRLRGQIDRIDRLPDGAALLLDYKTEPLAKSKERVKAGNEDTQLPFYALLAGGDAPRAAYLNLSEREPPSLHELPDLPTLAAQLYEGMAHDMARIAAGAPLPALGEGSVCDWCDARGLCRKDWWAA